MRERPSNPFRLISRPLGAAKRKGKPGAVKILGASPEAFA